MQTLTVPARRAFRSGFIDMCRDAGSRACSRCIRDGARFLLLAIVISWFAAASPAWAQDTHGECLPADLYLAAARLPAGMDDGGDVVAAACRNWPFDPALRLSAVAFATGPYDDDGGGRPIELVVAVRRGRELVASTTSDSSEDASVRWSHGALAIDTARYDLAPGRRAFGVIERTGYSPPCADGSANGHLTLYMIEGPSLRPVLNLYLARGLILRGACFSDEEIVERTATITIALADRSHNGFRDLRLSADIAGPGGRAYSAVVEYDGQRYDLDEWEAGFDRAFHEPLQRQ